MLLGIFSAKSVLPLEFKPAHSEGVLLMQHLDELEHEAERNVGALKALNHHLTGVYRITMPQQRAA
jgi:hypothetical protein